MLKIREAIIVEGKYDKIKLKNLIDAPIIETNGFRVFSDREKQRLIREIAEKRGILILTDSDGAGFLIRNFLKGAAPKDKVRHCYIPQLKGKEKRKAQPGKEGLLGVEGVSDEVILEAIKRSGATVLGGEAEISEVAHENEITKADLCSLGLTGGKNSAVRRKRLMERLELPSYLSTNAMLTALNCLYSLEELKQLAAALDE